MKKITLFAIITLVFLCFSCDNEPYDGEIFIEDTTIEVPTTPTDPVDPSYICYRFRNQFSKSIYGTKY